MPMGIFRKLFMYSVNDVKHRGLLRCVSVHSPRDFLSLLILAPQPEILCLRPLSTRTTPFSLIQRKNLVGDEYIVGRKIISCPHCGKIIPKDILKAGSIRKIVTCPECGSQRNYKDGLRYTRNGENQRY